MANFKQAKEWMRKGKKVRRPIWDTDSYWQVANDQSERIVWSDGTNAVIHLKQLEANDWCVYSPKVKYITEDDITRLKNLLFEGEFMNASPLYYFETVPIINKFMETLKHG